MKPGAGFIIEDGTLERYAGPGKDVAIPAGVTTIAEKAFQGNARLRSVRFPDREMDLASAAFAKCRGLERVVLPRKTPLWLSQTFYRCRSLGQIRLPECQKEVGQYCFFRCTALRNVTMPRVEAIRNAAFSGCTALEEVRLPPTLRVLDYRAFHQCRRLKEVVFPARLDRLGDQAFAHCTGLERVVLPRRIARLGNGVFSHCPRLKEKNIEWPGHTDAEKRGLLSFRGLSLDLTQDPDPISREIAVRERAERGFCESDWGNLCYVFPVLLPDLLQEFADQHMAYPEGMAPGRWTAILREMAARFRAAREQEDDQLAAHELKAAFDLFQRYFPDLWD